MLQWQICIHIALLRMLASSEEELRQWQVCIYFILLRMLACETQDFASLLLITNA